MIDEKRAKAAGYCALPAAPDGKFPACKWKGIGTPNGRRVTKNDLRAAEWARPWERWYLFPASHKTRPLAVVDVDNLDLLPEALELFGETPLRATTRRGVHLYYLANPLHKVTSRSRITGVASGIDVKSWSAGVVAYPTTYPIEEWGELEIPEFRLETYERVWRESRPKQLAYTRKKAREAGPKQHPYLAPEGSQKGSLTRMGDVHEDTLVVHERTMKPMRLADVPLGDKVFAFDREDSHASSQVWGDQQVRWYTDHTLAVLWKVVRTPPNVPIAAQPSTQRIRKTIIRTPYVTPSAQPGLTVIRAPHGLGKTVWSAQRMDAHPSGLTIANTALLAEHNAARFDIANYQDLVDAKRANQVSTTINSLTKFAMEPEIVHVDEADQVLDYLHSGTVHKPSHVLTKMLNLMARAKETIITSADLSDEHIKFFVAAYRARNPRGRVRVLIYPPPKEARRTVRLVSLAQAKSAFIRDAREGPIAFGWTQRRGVADIARGMAPALWVSGENSRFYDTVELFRNGLPNPVPGGLFFFSPALQSGVSIEQPFAKVYLLHDKLRFNAETVAQMAMRFRNVEDTEIVWGVSSFAPSYIRHDDEFLTHLCHGLADETSKAIGHELPRFQYNEPESPEFLESWRIFQRQQRKTLCDPLGRIRAVCELHGWTIVDERQEDFPPCEEFAERIKAGKEARQADLEHAISTAKDLSDPEAEEIQRAHEHDELEPQELAKKRIGEFYGMPVTRELIRVDNRGRYRNTCKRFINFWRFTYEPKVLAELESKHIEGKQKSEWKHAFLRAQTFAQLYLWVFGKHTISTCTAHASHLRRWIPPELCQAWEQLFGKEPRADVAWVNAQMRDMGAKISRSGDKKDLLYTYSWDTIMMYSKEQRANGAKQHVP